jgi:hypothetical protein
MTASRQTNQDSVKLYYSREGRRQLSELPLQIDRENIWASTKLWEHTQDSGTNDYMRAKVLKGGASSATPTQHDEVLENRTAKDAQA